MAYEVTDGMLRDLMREWVAALPEQYPEKERPQRFSLRFYWRMRPILRKARREEAPAAILRGGRFAAALLTAALLTATVAMAFPSVRERVFRMVWERHEDYTRLYYQEVTEGDAPEAEPAEDREFTVYRFSYLPEGFRLEDYIVLGHFHHETFSNEEGLGISLDQDRLGEGSPIGMTGDIQPEEILLNGEETAWYVDRPGLKSIHWDDGVYAFHVITNLSREETIKIAESLTPVEEPFSDVKFTPYRATRYLPEGFSAVEAQAKKDSYTLRWEAREGGSLTLDQRWTEWEAFSDEIGERDTEMEDLFLLEGQQVKLLEWEDRRSLYWSFGEYSFRLTSDTLSLGEMTKVAINLHPDRTEVQVLAPYHLTYLPEGFEQSGNGYTRGMHYEDFYEYDETAEFGGFYQEGTWKIGFHQQLLEEPRDTYVIDPETVEGTEVTLPGGRTVWVLADPPEEKTLWTQYTYAVWWEEGEYFLSLWSSLPWEETVKLVEGIEKM